MRIVMHIITGLNTGGAERALYNVIQGGLAERYQTIVVSLTNEGRYGPMLKRLGVPVYCLGMTQGIPSLKALVDFRKIVKMYQPDIVQGWMYHGNILANVAGCFSSKSSRVVWNIRHCLYDLRDEKILTQWIIRLSKMSSMLPAAIVYNSHLSRSQHEQFGFSPVNGVVIPNGFDLGRFSGQQSLRSEVRNELNLAQDATLIGHVGRYHPMKDHACFLRAAVIVLKQKNNVVFLMAGKEVDVQNRHLTDLIPDQYRNHFLLLGERNDVQRLYKAMDVFCLSSFSEAFPNVLGEAMSSSLPCITTNVGDGAFIVGEAGFVVPPRTPGALAAAMLEVIEKSDKERHDLGKAARQRVEEHFSLKSIVENYSMLYDEMSLPSESM